jgi:hypothetical protein
MRMSGGAAGPSRPLVLRAKNTMLVPIALWAFCVGALADAVIEGSVSFIVDVAVLMATIAFLAWLAFASPCLVVQVEGLRVVNPLRVHWIPYAALDEVRVRGLTTLTARASTGEVRSVTSWNAPGQPRTPQLETPSVAELVERTRYAWEVRSGAGEPDQSMITTWRIREVAVLAVLVVANIAIWFR